MSREPIVAKTVWTDADFNIMNWHDNAIHALACEPAPPSPGRLLVDLDYIVACVAPSLSAHFFGFWICPATLVFEPAWDLTADIDLRQASFALSLDQIERSGPDEHAASVWTLAGHEFTILLSAIGFTQYLRRAPIFSHHQRLPLNRRGGISFDQHSYML